MAPGRSARGAGGCVTAEVTVRKAVTLGGNGDCKVVVSFSGVYYVNVVFT